MCSMCSIREEQHIVCMQEVRDGRQLRHHTVVRWIDEERRACLGMFAYRRLHRMQRHPHRNAEPRVNLRLHINGANSRKDHRPHDRAVHVARHEDGLAGRKRRHQHCMDRARRPIHHKVRRVRAVRLCRKLLRRTDTARRRMEIIQFRRKRDIRTQPCLRKEAAQHGMRPAPALVPRRMHRQNTQPRIAEHGIRKRRAQCSSTMRFCTRRCTLVPLPGSERI